MTEMESAKSKWSLPILQGILPLDRSRIGPDVIAGLTLAALGMPQAMGYTKIIGTPVITGLYTLFLPVLIFALFGSSRHLVVAADSATAAMVAAGLTALSYTAYSPRYTALAGLVGIVAAAILIAARILKLGFLADFLSRTVLVGFLSGVGVQVALSEIHGMLGIESPGNSYLRRVLFTFRHISDTNLPTMFVALAVLAIIVVSAKVASRFPGALLAIIGMTICSAYFHWADHGVVVVGMVPRGLPRIGLPDVNWSDVILVLPIAFSCFIVILAQSAATSRAYALRYRDQFNQDNDLIGLALANAAAGCSSTFIVNGSPTQTATVDTAGGRSQLSQVVTSAVVLLVLLFFTKPLSFLPNAVLAAIVFVIGVKLVDFRGLDEIRRKKPREFVLAIVTAATVVLMGVEQGILLAVILSLLQHVRNSYRPHTAVVVRDAEKHWEYEEAVPGRMLAPGLVMLWFGSDLFYANAAYFAGLARKLVDESPTPVRWLAIDAKAITSVDYSAGRALIDLQQDLAKEGVVLALVIVSLEHHTGLRRLGIMDAVGQKHVFDSRKACLKAYKAEYGLDRGDDTIASETSSES